MSAIVWSGFHLANRHWPRIRRPAATDCQRRQDYRRRVAGDWSDFNQVTYASIICCTGRGGSAIRMISRGFLCLGATVATGRLGFVAMTTRLGPSPSCVSSVDRSNPSEQGRVSIIQGELLRDRHTCFTNVTAAPRSFGLEVVT